MADSITIGVAYKDPAIVGGTLNNTPVGGTTPAAGAFTTLTSTGNSSLGNGASDVIGFYGVTGTAQLSLDTQATITISWITICASKFGFGTSNEVISLIACVKEIQHVLTALGLWKGAA